MSDVKQFADALKRGDHRSAERHLTNMPASELAVVRDACRAMGQHDLAAEFDEHVRLRALGEAGVRIRVPIGTLRATRSSKLRIF